MPAGVAQGDRFLQQLEDLKRQKRHMERLKSMTAAIDNKGSSTNLSKIDAKKVIRRKEKAEKIHKENLKILNKIASIVKRKNTTIHSEPTFRTHSQVNRKHNSDQIDRENMILCERLKTISSTSTYSREKYNKEREETERHIKRISHSNQKSLREKYLHKFLEHGTTAPVVKDVDEEKEREKEELQKLAVLEGKKKFGDAKKMAVIKIVPKKVNSVKKPTTAAKKPTTAGKKPESAGNVKSTEVAPVIKSTSNVTKSNTASNAALATAPAPAPAPIASSKSASKENIGTPKKTASLASVKKSSPEEKKYADDFEA